MISVWAFSLHSEQSVFRTAPALKCVLNNKVSTSLTLSRTEGIAVERIQHLNTEFRTEVKKGTLSTEPESIFSFTCNKYKFIQTHWNSKSDASHQCSLAWISEPMQSLLGCLGRGYRSRSYNCFDIILLSHRVHNNVPTY